MQDLLHGVMTYVKEKEQENILFKGEQIVNNRRLDVFKNKMEARDRFCEILKPFVYDWHDEDGVVAEKTEFLEKKKTENQKLYNLSDAQEIPVIRLNMKQYERIKECSSWLQYETDVSWKHHRIKRANRCMHKYCPHCARVQSLKRTLEAQDILNKISDEGYEFLFITLTLKNVKKEDLRNSIKEMNRAINQKLLRYADIKKVCFTTKDLKELIEYEKTIKKHKETVSDTYLRKYVKKEYGFEDENKIAEQVKVERTLMKHHKKTYTQIKNYVLKNNPVTSIRKFEVTYNPFQYKNGKVVKRKGKKVVDEFKEPFHPHLHLILAIDPKKYFRSGNYISNERLAEMWKKAMKLDYLPQVKIEKVKRRELTEEEKIDFEYEHADLIDREKELARVDGAFEIGKYIAKSSEYLQSSELFETFFVNLFKIRAWTFTGKMKTLHSENVKSKKKFNSLFEDEKIDYVYETDYNYRNNNYYMNKMKKVGDK